MGQSKTNNKTGALDNFLNQGFFRESFIVLIISQLDYCNVFYMGCPLKASQNLQLV